jgi:hypothetical protein
MSSRWISISFSGSSCHAGLSRLIVAWTAFTSDDFPMPRAPHKSTLFAGRPEAKRWCCRQDVAHAVDAAYQGRYRRDSRGAPVPARHVSADHTKQSAALRSAAAVSRGARRETASIRRSSFCSRVSDWKLVIWHVFLVPGSRSNCGSNMRVKPRKAVFRRSCAVALAQRPTIFRPVFQGPVCRSLRTFSQETSMFVTPAYAQASGGR